MTHCERVLELLSDGREHSHHELYALNVVAHSRVSELRRRGYVIDQRRVAGTDGEPDYVYSLRARPNQGAGPGRQSPEDGHPGGRARSEGGVESASEGRSAQAESPIIPVQPSPRSLPERFREKVAIHSDGCWLWRASRFGHGYGRFKFSGRDIPAHRVAYESLIGPIPKGMQLDHLCRVRHCVNPEHLEPVTNRENGLRGESFAAANARKTHCPQGHPYDEENTYIRRGGRRGCRACNRPGERRRKRLAKQGLLPESPEQLSLDVAA